MTRIRLNKTSRWIKPFIITAIVLAVYWIGVLIFTGNKNVDTPILEFIRGSGSIAGVIAGILLFILLIYALTSLTLKFGIIRPVCYVCTVFLIFVIIANAWFLFSDLKAELSQSDDIILGDGSEKNSGRDSTTAKKAGGATSIEDDPEQIAIYALTETFPGYSWTMNSEVSSSLPHLYFITPVGMYCESAYWELIEELDQAGRFSETTGSDSCSAFMFIGSKEEGYGTIFATLYINGEGAIIGYFTDAPGIVDDKHIRIA